MISWGWGVWIGNCFTRLFECALTFCVLICCWWRGNKVSAPTQTRVIEVGVVGENDKKKHNKIKTSKYTLLTFLPKNLSEQFRRIVNFYFLIVTAIAFIIDSPVSPLTSLAPLTFMVFVTSLKQGYEDWLRHKADNKVNNEIVEIINKGVVKQAHNSTIAPGTLVRVGRGKAVPADLVLLCSSSEKGKCFVTTANLDGETNLKTLRVPQPLVGYTPEILPSGIRIEVPNPVADLYTFYGRLELPGGQTLPLTTDNLMLRGSRHKNTEWAVGCVIYTGEDTKLALNLKYASNKFSSCELAVNEFIMAFIGVLLFMMFSSLAAKVVIDKKNGSNRTYIGIETPFPPPVSSMLQDLFSFLLLYYYIIPMSLYVTIEMFKFIGSLFVGWDEDLRCEETGKPAIANTSDLNEELGQVEVLFSDKTGTLTKNLMVFKACSIKGIVYEERDGTLYDIGKFDESVGIFQTDINFFFTILALCHAVQVSSEDMKRLSARLSLARDLQVMNLFKRKKIKNAESNGVTENAAWNGLVGDANRQIEYQASSPDEKALVEAADRIGVTFLGEEGNNMLVKVGEETVMYEKLQMIEFTSDRKRMSVILRDKDGKIWLFCKGAESAVFPLCNDSNNIEEANHDITAFANRGLRTLAIAYRQIPDEEYDRIADAIRRIDAKNPDELQKVTQQYRILERELTLIGLTAVEDCLQDDVADTLASLRRAGLRIWVLTGDKVETAIAVAQSCAHISEDDRRMFLVNINDEATVTAHLEECQKIIDEPTYKDLTLVVDGTSMSHILDSKSASTFADISLHCSAVLCCRLSPLQKAKIVKLIKSCPSRPITAAIGDGANDISMIQEAHVGFGIFGKEGHQAARCADFAFTKFSMVKKMLLVHGHWYYQRMATLILYFFYKNIVLVVIMFIFQLDSSFSTQSLFDSMYLTLYNTLLTAVPIILLAITEQRFPADLLMNNPMLYREIGKNKLMSWSNFGMWCLNALYHALVIYFFSKMAIKSAVINSDGKNMDLWTFGAIVFHLTVIVVNLKLWLLARYQTWLMVGSVLISIFAYILFNLIYSLLYFQIDGDVLGTYTRLWLSFPFLCLNILAVVVLLLPDFCYRVFNDLWGRNMRLRRARVVTRL